MTHVENPARYQDAIDARIRANAKKHRVEKYVAWLQAHPENQRAANWLKGFGEFAGTDVKPGFHKEHPARWRQFDGDFGGFLWKLACDLDDFGKLSDKQSEIVRNAMARAVQRQAEREVKRAEAAQADAGSQWIGSVGERRDFALVLEWAKSFDSQYGTLWINRMKDRDGNVVVYKGGSALGEPGAEVRIKATIKAHEERDGVKQTIVNRPKEI